jgi:methionine-rich copper-binding protein CopC
MQEYLAVIKRVAITLLILFTAMPSASAHATLTDSNPKAGSVLSSLPELVWVEFDGNLQTIEGYQINKLVVTDQKGNRLDDGNFKVGGARLAVEIIKPASGKINFNYRVVSEDGHPVEGSFNVQVGLEKNTEIQSSTVKPKVSNSPTSKKNIVVSNSPSSVSVNSDINPNSNHAGHSKFAIRKLGFWEHHAVHISEFLIAFFLIVGWFFYRKFK